MGLPAGQVEPLQVVSYRDGQHFRPHHDAGTLESDDEGDVEDGGQDEGKDGGSARGSNSNLRSGSDDGAATSKNTTEEEEEEASKKYKVALVAPRRLVTFFVYLNTLPPGVGATHFPALGLHVQPKARSALVFCNVQPNGHPDPGTVHEAQPVGEGYRKFGMNLWISDTSCLEYASATGPHAGVTYSKAHSQSSPSLSTGRNKNGSALKASSRRKSGGGGGTPLVECDTSPASASSSVSSSSSSSSGSSTGWESGFDGGVGLSSGGVLSALEHFETARREVVGWAPFFGGRCPSFSQKWEFILKPLVYPSLTLSHRRKSPRLATPKTAVAIVLCLAFMQRRRHPMTRHDSLKFPPQANLYSLQADQQRYVPHSILKSD